MRWGVVATVKSDAPTILRFVAYHLELGAHRVHIYLDAPCPQAQTALRDHPKCRVKRCDDGYWKRRNGKRPETHQARQTFNATHAYRNATDIGWLMHLDVDEFLVPRIPVADQLAALPVTVQTARVRPMEILAGGDPQTGAAFKRFIPAGPDREETVAALYPEFGQHLKGGFLSHIAGKIFVRTGIKGLKFRIHNAFLDDRMNPGPADLDQIDLAHFHALDWDSWQAHYTYRLAHGSYREGLGPARPRDRGGITMHELFTLIEEDSGQAGLRRFFDEVCSDSPDLRRRLAAQGLLSVETFPFDTWRAKHFPDIANI